MKVNYKGPPRPSGEMMSTVQLSKLAPRDGVFGQPYGLIARYNSKNATLVDWPVVLHEVEKVAKGTPELLDDLEAIVARLRPPRCPHVVGETTQSCSLPHADSARAASLATALRRLSDAAEGVRNLEEGEVDDEVWAELAAALDAADELLGEGA